MTFALRLLIPIATSGTLGGVVGYFGQCTSGTCPLTSTWWRGALYGGVIGLFYAMGPANPIR